jgi:mRNA interferase MazF
MKQGDIILTAVPQADGQTKNRPALFLREMPPFGDALVCGSALNYSTKWPGLMNSFAAQMLISRPAGWSPNH